MERRLARIAALPLSLCLAIPALAHGTPGPASGEAREVTTSAWADAYEAATEAHLLDVATSGPPNNPAMLSTTVRASRMIPVWPTLVISMPMMQALPNQSPASN